MRVVMAAGLLAAMSGLAAAADLRMERATNKGIVQLMTGGSAGTSIGLAEDLASIVDDGATRRLLPVVGRSAVQNLSDLISLRGIDMAILQTDVVDAIRQQRAVPGIEASFSYITKLYNKEFHLLARQETKTIFDLAGQKVNLDIRGSGTSVTGERLFELLRLSVQITGDSQEIALDKLRRGEIAAMAFVSGKPATIFQTVKPNDGLHFLAVPLQPAVIGAYPPTSLSAADYPGLIADNQPIDTVAIGTLLAVANLAPDSERYKNVVNFMEIFFGEFRTLLAPGRHPKWREINLATEVRGWRRFPPAQQWLDRNRAVVAQTPQDVSGMFSRFLETRQQVIGGTAMSEQQKRALFEEFQRWQSGRAR